MIIMDPPPSAPDEFILPKRTKKRRNNRSDLTPLSFSAKLERERASLRQDAQWLSKTLRQSAQPFLLMYSLVDSMVDRDCEECHRRDGMGE